MVALLMLLPQSVRVLRQSETNPELLEQELLEKVEAAASPGMFNLREYAAKGSAGELFEADFLYPVDEAPPVNAQFFELSCAPAETGDAKSRAWINYKCKNAPLPKDFFSKPPLRHPLGGSWAWYAHLYEKEFESPGWLKGQAALLHIQEQAQGLEHPPQARLWQAVVADLTPAIFGLLEDRNERLVETKKYLLSRGREAGEFRVLTKDTWRALKNETVLDLRTNYYGECALPAGWSSCWILDRGKILRAKAVLLGFGAGVILLVTFLFVQLLRERRAILARAASDRLLMVQTLTHELRHPVTGLRLSLETFRDRYDDFDDNLKGEFLRMTGQMQKLQRMIKASEQYLQSDQGEQLFSFKKVKIDSLNDFLLDVLDPYQDKIAVETLKNDTAVEIDPYWYGMCVTNLVKNALMHGQKPIHVKAEIQSGKLVVTVADSGQGLPGEGRGYLDATPKKSTGGGMGLGLSLVARIIRLMGGELSYQHKPGPVFTLTMEIPT